MKIQLLPLFDSIHHLHKNCENIVLPEEYRLDFNHALNFLKNYQGSLGTFNSYRRETERLLQWCWQIRGTTLKQLKRDDIEQFVRFCQNPPKNWIGVKKVPRFIEKEGKRIPNGEWRPFVATISKSSRKRGEDVDASLFALSQGAIQEIFAILSTLFNFLIAEEYLLSNPVALIRQKSKFIRKRQQNLPVRRLSLQQWDAVLQAAEHLAQENPEKHERTRFILSALYGMYLRISELAASERWIPTMNDFAKDNNGSWWFTTVGKGNKERQIAVSEAMLASLSRWRTFLGLSPLPSPADNSPLLPKLRGTGPMSDTAPIRRLVQLCFDRATDQLRRQNQNEEADNLMAATVHWLRHTGISEDVKTRPREHVRDDAGHSSSATTDRYIDIELQARYQSARRKSIIPQAAEKRKERIEEK
ncbi:MULTISPECIES: tyrosine-type recombinase/integrase [Legionella]|uniref:Site-specific integrase n=1 Tax=Legionella septentrionalis TaxID=2498109 RepID=A0A3S0X5M4_9GAMM|nr:MULTISPECIES: tyrosine-type recombinase/integrase [Legionella]MCP0914122.1 tyrosine-type recombinase/integrase [Legionella sp. 27cVA30]RUQ90723.1 site-specific integrase [Legionella septentrionalis]RUQ99972.1 site-specific integrase [Legionella septentrionalis]RUR10183.1 site-specific integrase [Legionella septentrionalis]RUR15805.1 site-specific integrase [Legionella septentrionalis]